MGEVCMAIVCACLPTLRPLIRKIGQYARPRTQSSHRVWYRREPKRSYTTVPTTGWRTLEEAMQCSSTLGNESARCDVEEGFGMGDCVVNRRAMQIDVPKPVQRINSPASTGPKANLDMEFIKSPTTEISPFKSPVRPLYQPPERRRPSVQSILDEIVVTLPPNAMIRDGLGEAFPIKIRPTSQPSGFSTGSYNVYDEPATPAGLTPPKIKRLGTDGSNSGTHTPNEPSEHNIIPSASVDKRTQIKFQMVNWAPRSRPDPDPEQRQETKKTGRSHSASNS